METCNLENSILTKLKSLDRGDSFNGVFLKFLDNEKLIVELTFCYYQEQCELDVEAIKKIVKDELKAVWMDFEFDGFVFIGSSMFIFFCLE